MDIKGTLTIFALCAIVQGSPISKNGKTVLDLLGDLAANCSDNPLLNVTAKNDLEQCDEDLYTETKHGDFHKMAINCFSFLDINRRLCSMKSSAQFNLTERLRVETLKNITTDDICNNKRIAFSSLPEWPEYQAIVKRIFAVKDSCRKICLSDDFKLTSNGKITDEGPSFFCKVLNYASNILTDVQHEVDRVNLHLNNEMSTSHLLKTNNKQIIVTPEQQTTENRELSKSDSAKIGESSPLGVVDVPTTIKKTVTPNRAVNDNAIVFTSMAPLTNLTKTLNESTTVKTAQNENLLPAGEKPDISKDDDYVSEFNNPGDDSVMQDDHLDEQTSIEETGVQRGKEGVVAKKVVYDQELGSITVDNYLDEDDGSFFPMFFFGVATMVLLYIVYHNKNKIMGLLIEGRQSRNRRRTSRGHAYRKLDTLEQAISSNAPGATTKIIY